MRCIILGSGGREAIMADKLSEKYELYSIMANCNPTIKLAVEKSGGKFLLESPFDKSVFKNFIEDNKIELCVINNDDLLAAGMIDEAKKLGLHCFGPSRKGARIEWDKNYSLELVGKISQEMMIKSYTVKNKEQLYDTIKCFNGISFVIKPNGLTAGKGVKVGGEHFFSVEEGINIALDYICNDGLAILQEKIEGYEFTIMGFTDGKNLIAAPATFDYPYRYDGDKGPGTGGMGCFSTKEGDMPFLVEGDLEKCIELMTKTVAEINNETMEFNGVLNGGFFKTNTGDIKFMEFNARLGDPEALNVLSVLDSEFGDIVYEISVNRKLTNCEFKKTNSCVVYVVSKEYALAGSNSSENKSFKLKYALSDNVKVYCGSVSELGDDKYRILGNSRLFAVVSTDIDMHSAKKNVYSFINKYVNDSLLDYRTDICDLYFETNC